MADYFLNKVVAVTGGTDGIGKALVYELLARGARVATCSRNHDKLYQLQSDYPRSQQALRCSSVDHRHLAA